MFCGVQAPVAVSMGVVFMVMYKVVRLSEVIQAKWAVDDYLEKENDDASD